MIFVDHNMSFHGQVERLISSQFVSHQVIPDDVVCYVWGFPYTHIPRYYVNFAGEQIYVP